MKKFHSGKGLKSDLINDDGDMEKNLQTHISYFKKLSKKSGKNITYYAQFQTCQLLNIMMLVLNFWATNQFLSAGSNKNLFYNYGPEAVNYLARNESANQLWNGVAYNDWETGPMCRTFPTVVRVI